MRVLDLFCGAGGAAAGYHRAGLEVTGVDVAPQPRYPFELYRDNAVDVLHGRDWLGQFDAIHASPPCQGYSTQTADPSKHERLIGAVRTLLESTGLPYVIENVEGARREMVDPVRLCGSSFGLDLRRHRLFETNWPAVAPPCNHAWQTPRFQSLDHSMVMSGRLASVVGVHGHINYPGEAEIRAQAMGIGWMTNDELTQALPPAYTEFIGRQLTAYLRARAGGASGDADSWAARRWASGTVR